MDGLLVVDKPAGPTSHDVVARLRRALREPRIGHTGTLDPAATGVLPIVLGRATRLARFLSSSDKSYAAVVRLGVDTDTHDARGTIVGSTHTGAWPDRDLVEQALDAFRGTFLQQPPAYSAKKIDGHRSYTLARRRARAAHEHAPSAAPVAVEEPTLPEPVPVTVHALDIVAMDADLVTLSVTCSAGFYVRSLAHDLGERLGTGAHLLSLRRTQSGGATLDAALGLDAIERDPAIVAGALIPMARMLPGFNAVTLSADGVRRAINGCDLGPGDLASPAAWTGLLVADATAIRMVGPAGELVGLATPAGGGLLHPSVVLM